MRRSLIILFLLFFSLSNVLSQPIFENDKDFSPFISKTYSKLERHFQLEQDPEFEYRIWVLPSLRSDRLLFVFTQNKGIWKLRGLKYSLSFSDSMPKEVYKEFTHTDGDLGRIISIIEKNEYLTIPIAESLRDSTGKEAHVAVSDGVSFSFELISKKNKRAYFYHCPEYDMKEYSYIKGFTQVINIIKAIFDYFGLGDYYICHNKYLLSNYEFGKEIYS